MKKKLTVIGSTGLIGKQFLESIPEGAFEEVVAITRRQIPSLSGKSFIKQAIHDFSDLNAMLPDLKSDVLVCAMGTTIKTAGSQEAFKRVDHDLPLQVAKMALEQGCQSLILISSVGANSQSTVFYTRIKGLIEEDLGALGFNQYHILRPSILLGERQERRAGEFIGKLLAAPLSFMIPWKYKPIHARTIAAKLQSLINKNQPGKYIWEGKTLFRAD